MKQTASELSHQTSYDVLDMGKIADTLSFVEKLVYEHPDVDCPINNAGVQRPRDVDDFST